MNKPQIIQVPYANLHPNPDNARKHFDEEKLKSLAGAIEASGLQQFPVVTPIPGQEGHYMLVAGERRYRAIGLLGWASVPCTVADDADVGRNRVRGLVENIQRVDITPYETACELFAIKNEHKLSGETIGKMTGLSTNYVNLLIQLRRDLSDDVLKLWQQGNPRAQIEFLRQLVKVPRADQIKAFQSEDSDSGKGEGGGDGKPRSEPKHNYRKCAEKIKAVFLQMSAEDVAAVNAHEVVNFIIGTRQRPPQGVKFRTE